MSTLSCDRLIKKGVTSLFVLHFVHVVLWPSATAISFPRHGRFGHRVLRAELWAPPLTPPALSIRRSSRKLDPPIPQLVRRVSCLRDERAKADSEVLSFTQSPQLFAIFEWHFCIPRRSTACDMPSPRVIVVGGGCKSLSISLASPKVDEKMEKSGYPFSLASVIHEADVSARAVSGLSAAHTLYLSGGNVLVLDKQGMRRRAYPVLFLLRANGS